MAPQRLSALGLLLAVWLGLLTCGTGWSITGGIAGLISSLTAHTAMMPRISPGDSHQGSSQALLDMSAKTLEYRCSDEVICPGCLIVSEEAAAAVQSKSCSRLLTKDAVLCGQQELSPSAVQLLETGACFSACSESASHLCSGRGRLLQDQGAPPSFLPAPAIPVSTDSPFSNYVLNPPSSSAGSTDQYTTHWQCGGTQFNAEVYHSLRLYVENKTCQNQTSVLGIYICGGTVVDVAAYDALASGTCKIAACSETASCAPLPAPVLPPSACPDADFTCGLSNEFHVGSELFDVILSSSSCGTDSSQNLCVLGNFLVDREVFVSVKADTCFQECTAQVSVPCNSATGPTAPALAPGLPCSGSPSFVCGNQTLDSSLYDEIKSTNSCLSPIPGSCKINSSFIDLGLFIAVKSGICEEQCSSRGALLPCSAPAPVPSTAASIGRGAPPPCSKPAYSCGDNALVAPALYAAIRFGSCQERLPGTCTVGGSIVDRSFFDAINQGDCMPTCLEEPEVSCGGVLPQIAPAPSFECTSSGFKCGLDQGIEVAQSLYESVINSTTCIPVSPELCRAGASLIDVPTYAAIKSGTCRSLCDGDSIGSELPCAAGSPGSAQPPTSASTCTSSEILCRGKSEVYHLLPALYEAVLVSQQNCSAGICVAPPYIVEQPVWEAVKNGSCQTACAAAVTGCSAAPKAAPAEITLYSSPSFVLRQGEWSVCDNECSGETAYRSLTCRNTLTGLPVALDTCKHNLSDVQALSQPCGSAPCGALQWEAEPWSECSETCGDGIVTRNVTCTLNGQAVSREKCDGIPTPQLEEACYVRACSTATWQFTPWSSCSKASETRNISCVNPDGSAASPKECATAAGYIPASTRPCNQYQCANDGDCGGHGSCDQQAKTCSCDANYVGQSCNIFLGPCAPSSPSAAPAPALSASTQLCCSSGVVDYLGKCCDSGLVSGSSSCCTAGSVLDSGGECCPADQRLDACGECGGKGKAVDFLGKCCSGDIDASGICCTPPLTIDQFGVCGGDSNSGRLNVILKTQLQGGNETIKSYFLPLVADALQVSQSQISLETATGTQKRRKLQQAVAQSSSASEIFQVAVKPPYYDLAYPELVQRLSNRLSESGNGQPGSLVNVSAQGIPRNSICEIGELPAAQPNGAGVPEDCPLSFKEVPATANGPCNGRGRALFSRGQCDCWVGYTGSACDVCTAGYVLRDNFCVRTYISFQGYDITEKAPSPTVAGAALAMPLSVSVVGVVVLFAIGSFVVVKRQQALKRQLAGVARSRKITLTPRRDSNSSGLLAITDPECGASTDGTETSSGGHSRTRLDTGAPSDGIRTSALHSKPLAYLLNWLAEHGIAKEQLEGLPPRSASFTPGSDISDTDFVSLPKDVVVTVADESPKAKRARATGYTASTPESSLADKQRQRLMTWTQEEEPQDRAVVLRSPLKSSPSEVCSRRAYTFLMEHVSPEKLPTRRKLHPDFEVEASGASAEDYMAVPAAPKFQPVPEFKPASSYGLLTDKSTALDTPELSMIESAPTGYSEPKPKADKDRTRPKTAASQAFWPKLPWERQGEAPPSTTTTTSSRWKP